MRPSPFVVGFSAGGSAASKAFARLIRDLGMIPIAHDCSPRINANSELHKAYLSPELQDKVAYAKFLATFLADCDHYIPFLDDELLICLGLTHQQTPEMRTIVLSGYAAIELCNDKMALKQFLLQAGIPTPRLAIKAPAFVKPRFGSGGKQALLVKCDETVGAIRGMAESEGLIVEEYISGPVISGDILWSEECRLLARAYRFRSTGSGVSTLSSLVTSPRLLKSMDKIVSSVGSYVKFRGLTSFQFLVRGSESLLLEINPRPGGSISHSHFLGADILYQYFHGLLGANLEMPKQGAKEILLPQQIARFYEDCPVCID
jgi:hypothetical protein